MVLIAAGQLASTSSLATNASLVIQLIDKAVERKARILFLPEASDYIAKSQQFSSKLAQPFATSPFVTAIQRKLHSLYHENKYELDVSVGIHEPSATNPAKVLNTLIYFNSKGELINRYQKIHLFDVTVSKDAPIVKESNGVEPGNVLPEIVQTPAGKLGPAICYDIRFPELALRLRSLGAEILQFPSAFTTRTGAAHWHALARARAIDTQTYVVVAAQSGGHNTLTDEDLANGVDKEQGKPTRFSYGHTLIVDPWGTVVAEVSDVDPESLQIAVADIDLELVEKVRDRMPLWQQRRPDVFGYDV
jgi:beta-ureidopropionase